MSTFAYDNHKPPREAPHNRLAIVTAQPLRRAEPSDRNGTHRWLPPSKGI